MPRRVKSVSREIRAAIGELVIEVTFMQYLAARLVAIAGITDNEMSLLRPGSKPFKQACEATRTFKDPQAADRTRSWLREAEELERQRHEVVHSIVLHTHRAGLSMYHPRSGSMVRRTTREVVELAAKACKHAEDGNYMSIFDWPPALGLAGPHEVGDESG
jgi:hypothetical protein